MKRVYAKAALALAVLLASALVVPAADAPKELPRPDGKPADMSKPVQVYILLGQSNMLGAGRVGGAKEGTLENAVKTKKKYPYLVDDAGNWTVRKDVRNVRVRQTRGGMKLFNNEWMAIRGGNIGPEYGIGNYVGHATDAPVMILKSCCGNRSLGWDLLPPGSERYEVEEKGKTMVYAGYKDSPDKWEKGTEPKKIGWYAGKQYDDDTASAKKVLAELDKYYPGAKGYQVAGFFFWQGDKDRYNAAHANRYEHNLVNFIKALRKDFNAPKAKFVVATLGQTKKGKGGNEGTILEAQLAVDGKTGKYPEFKGNVASVYANPYCHGGSSSGHYGGNAETYMDTGEGMGRAMVETLMKSEKKTPDPKDVAALAEAEKMVADKQYVKAVAILEKLAAAKPDTDIAKKAAEQLKALQADPATSQAILDAQADAFESRCLAAKDKKDYVLAINLYEQYVKRFPKASRLAKVKADLASLKSDKTILATVKASQADADCKKWMSLAINYAAAGMNAKARVSHQDRRQIRRQRMGDQGPR